MGYQLGVDFDEPKVESQYFDEDQRGVGDLGHHLVYLQQKVRLKVCPVLWRLGAEPQQLQGLELELRRVCLCYLLQQRYELNDLLRNVLREVPVSVLAEKCVDKFALLGVSFEMLVLREVVEELTALVFMRLHLNFVKAIKPSYKIGYVQLW